jgi:hypothetical protein
VVQGQAVEAFSFFHPEAILMKTITKKLSILGVVAAGLIGCAESNDKNVMSDPVTGATSARGKLPAGAPTSSADFAAKNKGAMMGDAATTAKYKAETNGSGK